MDFDDLVEPGVKVEMSTAIHEIFGRYAQIVNHKEGGENVYAFDAHRLSDSLCRVWAELYVMGPTSLEEVLRDKALLEQEVCKLSESEEGRVKKLTGEINVCRHQLRTIQDS